MVIGTNCFPLWGLLIIIVSILAFRWHRIGLYTRGGINLPLDGLIHLRYDIGEQIC